MAPPLTRAQQLALRRRLLAEAAKRRPARVVPQALLPRPTQYTRALVDLANELDAEMRNALADEGLPVPRGDAADGEVPPFNRTDVLSRLQRIVDRVVRRRRGVLDKALLAVSAHVASVSKAQWARQARALLGIDLSQLEPDLRDAMRRFRAENLDLITSMAKDKVARVAKILADAPNARVETIRDRIMEEHGVTKRQAALIARDQVLSLNAQVTQARHEAAGVTRYVWRTSGDADVRPAHQVLDGKTFSYDDPPVVDPKKGRREHPGQDYQCRCTAEPVIEGFDKEPAPSSTLPIAPPGLRETHSVQLRATPIPGDVPPVPSDDPPVPRDHAIVLTHASEALHPRTVVTPVAGEAPHMEKLIDIVASVHHVPPMPSVAARTRELPPGMHARYRSLHGVPMSIETSTLSPRPHLETLHEFGHFLDDAGFGEIGRFASETDSAFADVMNALHETPTLERLRAMRDGTKYVYPGGAGLRVRPGDVDSHKKIIEYAIQNREVFARAYAQFITAETGHPTLAAELRHALDAHADRLYGTQWTEEEFRHVHRAFQQLVRRLNWR